MKFYTDIHVHTISSGHAYSTILENITFAEKSGLKILGITDHSDFLPGGAHIFHFSNLKIVPRKVNDLIILRGMEANVMDYEGNIDINEEYALKSLDYVIASFHPPCIEFCEDKSTVTKGIIGAMHNPWVKVIGHPGDNRYPFNAEEVVKASKQTGVILEINDASFKPTSVRPGVKENLIEVLKYCNKYDMPIMANTDAHICWEVGEFSCSIAFLEEINFPKELILNLYPEKLLDALGISI
ncbi:phosphatase [Candidatus Epulonipiscium fishelsonii]|uniref:Phosphatase n=1 Tax=Candidatus Epulonipiscium fishelsonii TaxID=77094 RepID=A0ACC8XCB1_9FIRM|nr:phosphatase [Epulopiscium sp. SCG-B11WGA-EpuloA1]ONI41351.1 phosphatase [Epulopiscium sp. SCG-B05WGA-EpuloA1]